MRKCRTSIVAVSFGLLPSAENASADDVAAASKPVLPSGLDASGIAATCYVSGQPTSRFGARVNVITGQNIHTPSYGYAGASKTSTQRSVPDSTEAI
jgi:hypothetical protein